MRSTNKSKEIFARAQKIFPGGVNSPVRAFRSVDSEPFIVARAEGPYLYDVDGNRYVDYINSWGPLVLGAAHPAVVEAIERQAKLGTSYGACCEQESKLAELIQQFVPSMEMLRFVNSGTEAAMSVLRLVRGFTGRQKIIKFSGCYHGHVDSLLVNAGSGVATLGIPGSAGVFESVTGNTCTVEFNDLEGVEKVFKEFPDEIAAVVLEPVVGNAGLILPQAGFLAGLRALTEKFGALLVFDEVMTGFRVGLRGAQGLYNVKPDLTMLGKVIGGGLPVGAFGGRKDIMQKLAPLGPVYQAGTLSGNPLAMEAGYATLREWTKPGVFEKVEIMAKTLVQCFRELGSSKKIPLCAESVGSMFGFFFQNGPVHNYTDAKRSDVAMFKEFFHAMLDRGVYFAPSQFEAGFVSAAHENEALQFTVSALGSVEFKNQALLSAKP